MIYHHNVFMWLGLNLLNICISASFASVMPLLPAQKPVYFPLPFFPCHLHKLWPGEWKHLWCNPWKVFKSFKRWVKVTQSPQLTLNPCQNFFSSYPLLFIRYDACFTKKSPPLLLFLFPPTPLPQITCTPACTPQCLHLPLSLCYSFRLTTLINQQQHTKKNSISSFWCLLHSISAPITCPPKSVSVNSALAGCAWDLL